MSTIAGELRGINIGASKPGLVGRVSSSFWQTAVLMGALLSDMSFLEHLEELRRRLIKCLIAVAVGILVSTAYATTIIEFLKEPAARYGVQLVGYGSMEIFSLFFHIDLASGVCLAAPVILYQSWRFIEPGLYVHERRLALPFLTSAMTLFVLGVFFGYAVATPSIMQMQNQLSSLIKVPWIPGAGEYISLLTTTAVVMGAVFEMPAVVFTLSRLGIVDGWFLIRNFRHAFLILTVLSAVLTPTGDIVPMLAFLGVMLALYAVSVIVAFIFAGKPREPHS